MVLLTFKNKQKMNRIFTLLLIIACFFISSCSSCGNGSEEPDVIAPYETIYVPKGAHSQYPEVLLTFNDLVRSTEEVIKHDTTVVANGVLLRYYETTDEQLIIEDTFGFVTDQHVGWIYKKYIEELRTVDDGN